MSEKHIRPENDVNRLNNQQVVLLTALVGIICAVASALVVVQIYSQNPTQTVVNTINRVTERIVENASSTPGEVVENTYVVREGDLVARAIETNRNATVSVNRASADQVQGFSTGFVLPNNRVVTLQALASGSFEIENGIVLNRVRNAEGLTLWTYGQALESTGRLQSDARGPLNLGETVVMLRADGSIERGIINRIREGEIGFSESVPENQLGALLDLSGNAIGLAVDGKVLPLSYINNLYTQTVMGDEDVQTVCENAGGVYSAEFAECVGINADTCTVVGGSFNSCASACRNDPGAEVCTDQCVQVCEL